MRTTDSFVPLAWSTIQVTPLPLCVSNVFNYSQLVTSATKSGNTDQNNVQGLRRVDRLHI